MDYQEAQEYVRLVRWRFAKSYAKTFPHEYTVKAWTPDFYGKFEAFVLYIRENGEPRPFFKQTYIYLEMDGYKYWTMGAPMQDTTVINREPLAGFGCDA
jgi:hypothetical protein